MPAVIPVHYPEVYRAIDQALWHIGKASDLLLPPALGAMMAEVASADPVVNAMRKARQTVVELREAFEQAEREEPCGDGRS